MSKDIFKFYQSKAECVVADTVTVCVYVNMRVCACVAGLTETHSQGPPGLPPPAGRSADLSELPLLHQRGD